MTNEMRKNTIKDGIQNKNDVDTTSEKSKEKEMETFLINETDIIFCKTQDVLGKDIPLSQKSKVVFLDTHPRGLLKVIRQVEQTPGVAAYVRDHYGDNPREVEDVAALQTHLGERAVITTRDEYPACTSLVEEGEFQGQDVLVIADADRDGILTALKAVGVTYPGIDQDAKVLDGPWSGMTEAHLTPLGFLLVKVWNTLPPFNRDRPETLEKARNELIKNFIGAVQGENTAQEWLEKKSAEYQKLTESAEALVASAQEVAPKVGLVDAVGKPRYDLPTFEKGIERRGFLVHVVRKNVGPIAKHHGGTQYYLGTRRGVGPDFQEMIKEVANTSAEEGVFANVPFLAQCSEKYWNEVYLPHLTEDLSPTE